MSSLGYNKKKVKERDGNRCSNCNSFALLTVDHIMPKMYGGSDKMKNLETLCLWCNRDKSSIPDLNFWQKLKYTLHLYRDFFNFAEHMRSNQKSLFGRVDKIKNENDNKFNRFEQKYKNHIQKFCDIQHSKTITELNNKLLLRDEAIDYLYEELTKLKKQNENRY